MAAGFLQPGIWEGDRKVGFTVRDVASGEECELARRVEAREGQHGTGYRFSDAGFGLARRALVRVASGALLVVDELGPVELRGRGHMTAVRRALAVPGLAAAVLVVRRQLVPSLLDALAAEDAVVIDVEEQGERSTAAIVDAIGKT
jgi:nucleoside-triphosphatase THEP1